MQQTITQSIAALRASLQETLAQQNWEAIGELDAQCRILVAALRDEDAFDSELREQIDALKALYDELQQSGRAERERLAGELTRLNQSKQVDQAYKSFS